MFFIKQDLPLLLTDKSSSTPKRIVAFHYQSPISTNNLLKTSNKTGKKNMFKISMCKFGRAARHFKPYEAVWLPDMRPVL